MVGDFSTSCLFTFFDEIRADSRNCVINDVTVTCSEDFKKLDIVLMHERFDDSNVPYNYTYTNKETCWMYMYEYIDVVKAFINAYNKYSDNGTAEPKTKFRALRRAYNERVHRCGETW